MKNPWSGYGFFAPLSMTFQRVFTRIQYPTFRSRFDDFRHISPVFFAYTLLNRRHEGKNATIEGDQTTSGMSVAATVLLQTMPLRAIPLGNLACDAFGLPNNSQNGDSLLRNVGSISLNGVLRAALGSGYGDLRLDAFPNALGYRHLHVSLPDRERTGRHAFQFRSVPPERP